jgi:NAD(P)-dependent dehydrogenase (short-subunit alcohol dehydrogenase family)
MATKKTIAILGAASEMGIAFAYNLARYDFRLILIDSEKQQLSQITKNIHKHIRKADTEAIECSTDGSWYADTILIAHPLKDLVRVANKIRQVATQKTVIHVIADQDPNQNNNVLNDLLPHSLTSTIAINSIRTSGIIYGEKEEALEEASYLLRLAGFYPYMQKNLQKQIA